MTPIIITPTWHKPDNVHTFMTTRQGGYSQAPFNNFNIGLDSGDELEHVIRNRELLTDCGVPTTPHWLKQVHGNYVVDAGSASTADGAYSTQSNYVCAVMTADCLPIVITSQSGDHVAALHAGWRSLAGGIVENGVATFKAPARDLLVWLGACIGPRKFEVGSDVRDAFMQHSTEAQHAFNPCAEQKWLADLQLLATQRLQALGITAITAYEHCTYEKSDTFFSYRCDGSRTGRMATLIWRDDRS